MSGPRDLRLIYQAKNNTTGLTDVKGQFYVNGVAKATGTSALVFTALDATNAPGVYYCDVPAATLTSWGLTAGASFDVEVSINSATAPAQAIFRATLSVSNPDDIISIIGTTSTGSVSGDIAAIQTKLGSPAGASVSADIASVKSDTSAIKADLETGSASLSTILSNIQALQNASISNGVGFVLPTMIIPATGSNSYLVPITVLNNEGALIDPNSNLITVGVKNSAGVDRGSFLVGSSGTPATVSATRTGTGQYNVTVSIPSTEVEEELIFSFSYVIGSNAMVRYGVSQTLADANAAGYALQSTLLATQTTVNNINTLATSSTYGFAALQALLANGTYGLAALAAAIATVQTTVSSNNGLLTNGTYGLAALQAYLSSGAYSLPTILAAEQASQGSGFVGSTDSLHAISQYLQNNVYAGGRAF